jgi:hypothetical protein
MKYDYYGNYDKEIIENETQNNTFSYSVQEIQKKQFEKDKMRTKIYEKISEKCFNKIKETSNNEVNYCFFQIPEYIPGYPIFNMTDCVMYLLEILYKKGFKAKYCDKYLIYISWNVNKPKFKLIENNKVENTPVIKELNLKYKPIENHQAFNFIPRKK